MALGGRWQSRISDWRRLSVWPLMLAAFVSLGFAAPHLVESDGQQLPVYGGQLVASDSGVARIDATALLIMDAATGRIVYERNGRLRLPPASTTKMMTAIVALERGDRRASIVVADRHLSEGSTMGLLLGDVVTLDDLLWGLLLPSGNDAALAIAELVAGSEAAFVALMNAKAQELGLRDTHFVNPHGLDEPDHYSSAYDLAALARYARSLPQFAQMVATERRVITTTRVYWLVNSNQLLRRLDAVPGVDGVKTGFSDAAGDCLVASAERDGHRVIAVVLGSEDRVAAGIALVNFAFAGYRWLTVGEPLFPQLDGASGGARLAARSRPQVMLPAWQMASLLSRISVLDGEGTAAVVRYYLGRALLAEVPLMRATP